MPAAQEAIFAGRQVRVSGRRPTREEGPATSLRPVLAGSKVGLDVCREGRPFRLAEVGAMLEGEGRPLGQAGAARLSVSTGERPSMTESPLR